MTCCKGTGVAEIGKTHFDWTLHRHTYRKPASFEPQTILGEVYAPFTAASGPCCKAPAYPNRCTP